MITQEDFPELEEKKVTNLEKSENSEILKNPGKSSQIFRESLSLEDQLKLVPIRLSVKSKKN